MTKPCAIRPAAPGDAPGIITHFHRITEEPGNMTSFSPGEFTRTVDEERERIERVLASDNSHMLVAVVDNEVVGVCACFGGVRAHRRTTGLGITIQAAWRNQGIGTALMEAMIQWARDNPAVHRLDLSVYTHNAHAIHLYRKLGFQEEGVRKEAYFKDGQYLDGLVMAMLFDAPEQG